jgi:hypothetical protein
VPIYGCVVTWTSLTPHIVVGYRVLFLMRVVNFEVKQVRFLVNVFKHYSEYKCPSEAWLHLLATAAGATRIGELDWILLRIVWVDVHAAGLCLRTRVILSYTTGCKTVRFARYDHPVPEWSSSISLCFVVAVMEWSSPVSFCFVVGEIEWNI